MSLPLSKYYDPADYAELAEELKIVDQHFTKAAPQSEHRRWEYAMALRALDVWAAQWNQPTYGKVVDVGGSGSPFHHMIGATIVVDPHEADGLSLADYVHQVPRLSQAVFCLSVLEHVDDLDQFLYHLNCLTAPGGLLFLTMDCCGCTNHSPEEDPHHFAGMRNRIFTSSTIGRLRDWFISRPDFRGEQEWSFLGGFDFTTYAPRLYGSVTDPGYSFASLALVKRS